MVERLRVSFDRMIVDAALLQGSDPEAVAQVASAASAEGQLIEQALRRAGLLDVGAALAAFASEQEVPVLEVRDLALEEHHGLRLVPISEMLERQALPIVHAHALAMRDPRDLESIDWMRFVTGYTLAPCVVDWPELMSALLRAGELSAEALVPELAPAAPTERAHPDESSLVSALRAGRLATARWWDAVKRVGLSAIGDADRPDAAVLDLIPPWLALRLGAMPLSMSSRGLEVASCDPFDRRAEEIMGARAIEIGLALPPVTTRFVFASHERVATLIEAAHETDPQWAARSMRRAGEIALRARCLQPFFSADADGAIRSAILGTENDRLLDLVVLPDADAHDHEALGWELVGEDEWAPWSGRTLRVSSEPSALALTWRKHFRSIAGHYRDFVLADDALRRALEASLADEVVVSVAGRAADPLAVWLADARRRLHRDDGRWDVFLSHATEDVALARELGALLKKERLRTFIAEDELLGVAGTPAWSLAIDRALDAARVVLVLASRDALRSRWVEYEWRSVSDDLRNGVSHATIVTVCTDGLTPRALPRALRAHTAIDLAEHVSRSDGLVRVSNRIRESLLVLAEPEPKLNEQLPRLSETHGQHSRSVTVPFDSVAGRSLPRDSPRAIQRLGVEVKRSEKRPIELREIATACTSELDNESLAQLYEA